MLLSTFLWRDGSKATSWQVEVSFADGSAPLRAKTLGPRMRVGEIDPRAVGPTNERPKLTAEQAAARTWKPDAATWGVVKARSVESPATVTITGFAAAVGTPVSRGEVVIRTSRDPVGAPIFYRDVPLMPSAGEKGVITPLATAKVPLIAWRLRMRRPEVTITMVEQSAALGGNHTWSFHAGDVTASAKALQLPKQTLYDKMKRLQVQGADYRNAG